MYKNYSELGAESDEGKDQYNVIEIQNVSHKQQLIRQTAEDGQVLCIDIYANWCQPCNLISPEYSRMMKHWSQRGALLVKENLDKKCSGNITGVPTFHFYQNGRLIHKIVGANLEEVKTFLESCTGQQQQQGSNQPEKSETHNGPQFYRNSIRNNASPYHGHTLPSDKGQPYQSNGGGYQQF
jgi:thioredoxin 1